MVSKSPHISQEKGTIYRNTLWYCYEVVVSKMSVYDIQLFEEC